MAVLEIFLILVTVTTAILLSPEPLVVRFPGTAQQLYLTSAPEFAKQAIYGLAVGEHEGKDKAVPMQYWLGRDKKTLASPAMRAKEVTNEATEEFSQLVSEAIRAAHKRGLAGKEKIIELEEALWAKATESARGTKEKAKEVIGTVEDAGARVAQKVILGPTLASLEMISSTAQGAKRKASNMVESVKENVRHGVESVEEAGRSVRESVSGVIGAVNDKVTKTGRRAWETVARVGETAWELEEDARHRAIETGHAFWYGICKSEDMAKLAFCRAEESTRRAAATVFQRGAAVLRCVKKEALHPDERKALAGKVEWCQTTAEDYASKAQENAGDFFQVLEDSVSDASKKHSEKFKDSSAREFFDSSRGFLEESVETGEKAADTAKGTFERARSAAKEGGEKISELNTHGVADWTKGKLSQAGETVRDKLGDAVDSGKEAVKRRVPPTDMEEGDTVFDKVHRGGMAGKETAEKAQDAVGKAAQKIEIGNFDETRNVKEAGQRAYERTKNTMDGFSEKGRETLGETKSVLEGGQNAYEKTKDTVGGFFEKGKETLGEVPDKFTTAVESKYQVWEEQFERMPEDIQRLFQEGWRIVDVAQNEGSGPRTWNRDITHSFFWVGFQRFLHLGCFSVAFAASLFLVVRSSSGQANLVQTELNSMISRSSVFSSGFCLGTMIQTWALRPELTNRWQIYALALAFIGSIINFLVLLPRIKKVLVERDELEQKEPEGQRTSESVSTARERNGLHGTSTGKPSWNPFSTDSTDTPLWRDNPTADLPECDVQKNRGMEMELPKSPLRVVRKYWSEEELKRLERTSKIANFLSLVGLMWHWWHLACRLVL